MANAHDGEALVSRLANADERAHEDLVSRAASSLAEPSTKRSRERFWTLWEAELPTLRKVASYWTRRNPEDAADVLSQATIRSCEAFERHASAIEEFGPWSRRVVKHAAIDLQRQKARHRSADTFDLELSQAAWETRASSETVHRQCTARDDVRRSIVRIAALPERLFAVAAPCLVFGVSYEEAAVRLGLHIENVRKRVQHARELLTLSAPECAPDGEDVAQSIRKILGVEAPLAAAEGPIKPWLVDFGGVDGARYHLSFGRAPTKRYDQRRASLLRYTTEHPRGWKKRWLLAEMLFAHGEWEAAATHYLALLRGRPLELRFMHSVSARLLELAALRKRADWVQAARGQGERAVVDRRYAALLDAYERLARGDLGAALGGGALALELAPSDLGGALERVRLYELAGERELAWETCRRAEQAHPRDIELVTRSLHLALLLGKRGAWMEGQLDLLLEHDPNNPIARCAAIRVHPDRALAMREVVRLGRLHPGWTLPGSCLGILAEAPLRPGLRCALPSARALGSALPDLCQSV